MNQEKIAKFIKEIRKKENLSQQKFAEKYGVTSQAVSKWENGKNIPDINILKEICQDYNINLNDLLDAKISTKNKLKNPTIPFIIITFLIIIITILIYKNNNNHFEFKTISTSCEDFNLYGSIAYTNNKSSIYISNITYCGENDNTTYKKIDCSLYENNNKTKIEISKCNYKKNKNITLETFLKNVNFTVDNYKKTCKEYKKNSLNLEINAIDSKGKITTYKIPLKLKDNCLN